MNRQEKRGGRRRSTNRLHRLAGLHDIELFEANETRAAYGKHAHETFAIGAITQGVGGYWCRGSEIVLPRRTLSLMNPQELHTGYAVAEDLQYRMVYVSEDAVKALLGLSRLRGFRDMNPVDAGDRNARDLVSIAWLLTHPDQVPASMMRVEELMAQLLARVFAHHGGQVMRAAGREPAAVRHVAAIIDAHVAACVEGLTCPPAPTIAQMAESVGLHPNYLIQSFGRARGISPHAWLIHRKIARAKEMMAAGTPAHEAAMALGFYDQSHFIRHFRRIVGVSPGGLIIH
ncbi:MAG: AraC family transcriptional regulator [Lautropia sp.]|nr:AraC family transcriptional regulator [Lautropia sp.]